MLSTHGKNHPFQKEVIVLYKNYKMLQNEALFCKFYYNLMELNQERSKK